MKLLVKVTEGSQVTDIVTDSEDAVTTALVQEAEKQPIAKDVTCNPDMISAAEALYAVTSEDVAAQEEAAAAEEAAEA